jgi:hypothetical protein
LVFDGILSIQVLYFVAKRMPTATAGLRERLGKLWSRQPLKGIQRRDDYEDSEAVQMMHEINLDSDSDEELH